MSQNNIRQLFCLWNEKFGKKSNKSFNTETDISKSFYASVTKTTKNILYPRLPFCSLEEKNVLFFQKVKW